MIINKTTFPQVNTFIFVPVVEASIYSKIQKFKYGFFKTIAIQMIFCFNEFMKWIQKEEEERSLNVSECKTDKRKLNLKVQSILKKRIQLKRFQ